MSQSKTGRALALVAAALLGYGRLSLAAPGGIVQRGVRLPPFNEIAEQLRLWQQQRPACFRVEEVGKSQDGRAILLCHITDLRVPEDDKQRILFSSMHSAEVDGPLQLLYMMKWLLGSDARAKRIREQQHVLVFPCMNPDSYTRHRYFNEFGSGLSWGGLRHPDKYPVGAAYDKVLRHYLPEAHVGVHATSGRQRGWMAESFISGDALLRPSEPAIAHRLLEVMDKAGLAFVYGEHGAQQVRATRLVPGAASLFHRQFSYCSETTYAYHVTKGVPLRTEIGWQESFLAGARGFMEMGNEVWRGERHRGYPVNRLAMVGPVALAAWGETAAQRRASRCELWSKIGQIALGALYPEQRGRAVAVYCSDPSLRTRLRKGADELDGKWDRFLNNLAAESIAGEYALDGLRAAGRDWPQPAGVWLQRGELSKGQEPIIKAGLCLRVHLPYPNPTITQVCLDGRPTGSYVAYHNPGTIVEVPVPPGAAKPLHFVSVAYEPDRQYKEGFTPDDWALRGGPAR